ncbi:hypothetical protein DFQ28_011451 [Apophysomyces sp. BC1034]|nr:hypothetical protein DFQ30_011069 [Apophysomyces sp. BC1015]KAG0181154.1 hypothetical protein DFQ29_009190 [Apophysomyces sp. BC1021]KAG0191612.1 hypothetical protein DFQ28_011451 [Apophysomyces sp. BC1034]
MDPSDQPVLESLPPSAQLALLHAQAAHSAVDTPEVEPIVPSPDDPVVIDNSAFAEPLIAGDHPTPITKSLVAPAKKEKKKDAKLDLSSESAFPSLSSSAAPRAPVASGWSAAASRVKTQPVSQRTGSPAPPSGSIKKPTTQITDVLELPGNEQIANQSSKPLGFKSNADVMQQVINKTGTTIIASTNRAGTTTFLIQGTLNDVARAKRELIAGLVVKRTAEISVPSSTRRFIIGAKGKNLQQIEAKSSTRINIPPRKDEEEEEQSEEDMVNISIVGDVAGIKIAKEEIEKIVSEKTAKQTIKIDHFDAKYHLFLAGPRDSSIKVLEQELGIKIQSPRITTSETATEEQVESAFTITGDKEKVQLAKQHLETRYSELRESLRTAAIAIPKRQHKYLLGKGGATLQEIFSESGCTVELPSLDDASENVTIRGPDALLINGLTQVMNKSREIHVNALDLASVHETANPSQHGKHMLKYFSSRGSLKKIEQDHNVEIAVPNIVTLRGFAPVEFYSKNEKDVSEAYKAAYELSRKFGPEFFSTVDIEPHLHRHISVRHGKQIQRIKTRHSVDIVVPEEKEETASILIVYEGSEEAQRKESLEAAATELKKIAADSSDFVSKTISIPAKYHKTIIGPKGTTLNAIVGGDDSTVAVRFGSTSEDAVVIRGLTGEVNHVIAEINKVYEAAKHEEFVNSHSVQFTIPAAYSAHVIGKAGSNINKLKEDLGVKIDISDPSKGENGEVQKSAKKTQQKVTVVIQGIMTNVEAAKERILALVANLADQVTLSLNVPKEFHRFLIGPSGRYVKKLEDKYNVFVKFPKSSDSDSTDTITIRGRKKDANSAKEELVELYEYEKELQNKRKEREARIAEEKKKAEEKASTAAST